MIWQCYLFSYSKTGELLGTKLDFKVGTLTRAHPLTYYPVIVAIHVVAVSMGSSLSFEVSDFQNWGERKGAKIK